MKRLILILITLSFIYPIISSGAEKDSVSLNLIWEKEFPEPIPGKVCGGIYDVAFDKNRGGLFCPTVVVTGNSENAREIIYFDSTGEVVKTRELKEWTQVRISSNGKYIAIMHPEKYDGEFHYGPVDIETISGKFVKRIDGVYSSWWWVSPKGNEIIEKDIWADADIYYFRGTLGKDKANLWTGTENDYLQIGNLIGNLPFLPNGHSIAISPNGNYIAVPKAIANDQSYTYHLQLYSKYGVLLKEFDLDKKGWVLSSFSKDSKYLVVAVKNLVFLIDVSKKRILWRYESNDPYQLLNLGTTPDFPSDSLFYVAGVFYRYSKNPLERIMIFSIEGKVILDLFMGKVLNRIENLTFKVNKKGDMICYVTANKILIFNLRGVK
jgi:hypothetical protein